MLFFGVAFATPIYAQAPIDSQEKTKEIETDRPDVEPYTVPPGSAQMENGIAWTGDETGRVFDLTESLLRLGLADGTELRVGVPDYFYRLRRTFAPPSGFGDILVGMKQSLGNVAGFDLALVPALSFPTGSRSWTSGGIGPQIELPWQHEISGPWSISGTLGVFDLTDNGRRRPVGECQVEVEREIGKRLDGFAEFQGFDGAGATNHSLQIGGGYKLTSNQRIDYYVVIGLSRAAPNFAVGVGYSFRVDHFWRKLRTAQN